MIFSAAVSAQTAPPPQQPAPATTAASNATQGRHVEKREKKHTRKNERGSPDAEILGFLGDYEDTADGLDPISLSEQTDTDQPKRGNGP